MSERLPVGLACCGRETSVLPRAKTDVAVSHNPTITYDVEEHAAEIHDQAETYVDDVELIRRLIGDRGRLRMLEPFGGTRRIMVPLTYDGHGPRMTL